jgi:predicted GNAT family acetyltransferase
LGTKLIDNSGARRYELLVDDELVGRADYELTADRIAILHIEVDPSRAGHGLGTTFADLVFADARRRGLGVLPYCPFARKVIADHLDAYLDLVPVEVRETFALPSGTGV